MFLPYDARPGQQELIDDIAAAQKAGRHVLVEAGTGTGKTISALTATLSSTADGTRIVYATRTNSQQAQVVAEHATLRRSGQDPGLLVPFMGRRQYCPLLRSDERFRDATPEELGKLCRDAKRKATSQRETGKPVEGACPHYLKLLEDGEGPVEALLQSDAVWDGPSLGRAIENAGSCPYEALKLLMPRAQVVVVPLVYVLDTRLRGTLTQWMGTGPDGLHLILDEAHHLPDAAREHHSAKLTLTTIQRAQREAEEFKDPVLGGDTLTTTLLDNLLRTLYNLVDEWIRGDDGLVPPGAMEETLLTNLRASSPRLERMVKDLEQWGDAIREDRRSKGRLPRSYLGSVAGFLRSSALVRDEPYVTLVASGDNPSVELYLLEPSGVLGWLEDYRSTLHMSGTLAPLDVHARLCGLDGPRTTRIIAPSPFDPSHLTMVGVRGIERRFEAIQKDPLLVERQQAAAKAFLEADGGQTKTGLWFPSHRMLQDYLEEGFLHDNRRPVYAERSDMGMPELAALVQAFKRDPDPGALLLGVLGGRLTEGLDFPGKTLERLLLFGVPYPRPSAKQQALVDHHDRVNGRGWEVAIHVPVARILRQAIGRLIRGPDDRGTAIILDDRIVRFRTDLPRLRMIDGPEEMGAVASQPEGYQTADRLQEKPS